MVEHSKLRAKYACMNYVTKRYCDA